MGSGAGNNYPCVCGGDGQMYVVDSRPTDYSIRRRRSCNTCGQRITTTETLASDQGNLGGNFYGDAVLFQRLDADTRAHLRRIIERLADD